MLCKSGGLRCSGLCAPSRAVGVVHRRCLRRAVNPQAARDKGGNHAVPAATDTAQAPSSSGFSLSDEQLASWSVVASFAAGTLLGLVGPVDEALPPQAQHLSAMLGWSYFFAWTISFYPQVLENQKRKSTDGLSLDYLVYSLIGYACYAAYTGSLYFSPGIQAAYQVAHAGSAPDVQLADFLFAAHAVGVTCYTIYQCRLYGNTSNSGSSTAAPPQQQQQQGLSPWAIGTAAVIVSSVAGYTQHIQHTCDTSDCATWLPLLGYLGLVKITMTLIKYTPQAWMNFQRRSTAGWQINNVLLDLMGGALSFAQIGVDAVARHDLSVVTGNPAKLGIAAISIAFDLVFMFQHYVLYPPGASSSPSLSASSSSSGESNQQQQQQQVAPQQMALPPGVNSMRSWRRVPAMSAIVSAAAARRGLRQR